MDNLLILGILTIVIVSLFFGETLPKRYRARSCEGKSWKTMFPEASKNEIRNFLVFFIDAFAFDKKDKLKFSPNDELLDIYKNLYPREWQADAMEFETLSDDLQQEFNISLEKIWHEKLTLGELFMETRNA